MIESVYIHIPFCTQICTYCDFCKVYYNKRWINLYLDSLKNEIISRYKKEYLSTIYIGGGTPSSLDIDELNKLFEIINIFNLNDNYEFTIECNVEDITEEKLILFKKNNINRLSIGVQTFNNKYLKYLGRTYTKDIALNKIKLAKKYFNNINIDLIYAIKDQTINELQQDLNILLDLDINHISCYSLMIEEHTKLYINKETQIDSDLDYKMYKLIDNNLNNKYVHYEISNYCKKGYESKHNLKYWKNEEYYGFGLSSSGYINDTRYTNTSNLTKYLNNNNEMSIEKIDNISKIKYELILGFRLKKGINKKDFFDKYNMSIYDIDNISKLINNKYLIDDNDNIYVNSEYIYVLNDILINFI